MRRSKGPGGISAFLLDREHVEVTRNEEKLGLNSSSTGELRIDTRIDGDRLLHEERKGFAVAMRTLDGGRIGIAAQALGIAQAAYDVARAYALERRRSASASPTIRRSSGSWRTCRPRSTPRGCSPTGPPG